jgi:hypothetical protein
MKEIPPMLKQVIAALAALVILTGCSIQIDTGALGPCQFTEERSATIPASGLKSLYVEGDSGFLQITGRQGLTEVRVKGMACATNESVLQNIKLETETKGDEAQVRALVPNGNGNRYLDLTLEVPADLAVRVRDDSGDTTIRNVASVDVTDESGDLEIVDITGDVRIVDDSGNIIVRTVGGKVTLEDESGEAKVEEVTGNVEVRDDSGDLIIRKITGSVLVKEDHSGDIEISDVEGSVIIDRDDSGSIDVSYVKGDFTVHQDGSGSLISHDIGGTVSTPAK